MHPVLPDISAGTILVDSLKFPLHQIFTLLFKVLPAPIFPGIFLSILPCHPSLWANLSSSNANLPPLEPGHCFYFPFSWSSMHLPWAFLAALPLRFCGLLHIYSFFFTYICNIIFLSPLCLIIISDSFAHEQQVSCEITDLLVRRHILCNIQKNT